MMKNMKRAMQSIRASLLIGTAGLLLTGCELRQAMYDQPKLRPLQASEFFKNGMASQPLVEGTVPRGFLNDDLHLHDGTVEGKLAETFPFPITKEIVNRGQQRYDIFCSPCHDRAGTGTGMIVQRGFKQPPSYHITRLQESSPGYFYNVIKNGFGVMSGYAPQIPVNDRWAIVAYIKALQLSQNAKIEDVPESMRAQLETK